MILIIEVGYFFVGHYITQEYHRNCKDAHVFSNEFIPKLDREKERPPPKKYASDEPMKVLYFNWLSLEFHDWVINLTMIDFSDNVAGTL